MMLTHSAANRTLTNRVTIDKLPEDVLLEIFDTYRQLYKIQPDYETLWNSRNGWHKLSHVCISWRRVVFSASYRLHLRLRFSPRRPPRDPTGLLRCFPPFPIFIDYSAQPWTEKEENLALEALPEALGHRGRVRGIALRYPYSKILGALCHPFPELESLEICHDLDANDQPEDENELILPATLLSGSAPCLRQLTLRGVVPGCLPPLFSFTRSLVELALSLNTLPSEALLLPNLQRMSCLRGLELKVTYGPSTVTQGFFNSDLDLLPPAYSGDVVPLSKLTQIVFTGHTVDFQGLVVGLAAPCLQHLHAKMYCRSTRDFFPIPHLCKFICDTEYQFTAVRFEFSNSKLKFHAGKGGDESFKIIISEPVSLEHMGRELSGPLSTVEELAITWYVGLGRTEGRFKPDQWRKFCYYVPQVKVVKVPSVVASDVAHSFLQEGQDPVLDLLPALQRVETTLWVGDDDHFASICDAFDPFIAMRQRVGRPIMLLFTWKYQFLGLDDTPPGNTPPPPTVYSGRL